MCKTTTIKNNTWNTKEAVQTYVFIRCLTMTIKIPVFVYGCLRWWSESLCLYMGFEIKNLIVVKYGCSWLFSFLCCFSLFCFMVLGGFKRQFSNRVIQQWKMNSDGSPVFERPLLMWYQKTVFWFCKRCCWFVLGSSTLFGDVVETGPFRVPYYKINKKWSLIWTHRQIHWSSNTLCIWF